jgi:hypothetical protein
MLSPVTKVHIVTYMKTTVHIFDVVTTQNIKIYSGNSDKNLETSLFMLG